MPPDAIVIHADEFPMLQLHPAGAMTVKNAEPPELENPSPLGDTEYAHPFAWLTFTTASAINPEVTIHVHRHPEGEWVCLESGGWAEAHGVGLADTRLYDERGVLGRGLQSLLVTPMSAPRPPDFAR